MSPEHAKAIEAAGKQIGVVVYLVADLDIANVRVQASSWAQLIAAMMQAAITLDDPESLIRAMFTARTYDLMNMEATGPLVVAIV